MKKEDTNQFSFPYYRKLSNSKVFYKIIDQNHFEEIQLMGTQKMHRSHEAIQYPEKLKIMDMIALEDTSYAESSVTEWQALVEN